MDNAMIRSSERFYSFLLRLYPNAFRQEFEEEMEYVFAKSLSEAYRRRGHQGIIALLMSTIFDAVTSIVAQHLDNLKGRRSMDTRVTETVRHNKVFVWITLATALILLIPLIAMQFTNEVNWTSLDFMVMGALLFGMGSLFVVTARRVDSKHWLAVGIVLAVATLYLWAELAVGIFTNWGS